MEKQDLLDEAQQAGTVSPVDEGVDVSAPHGRGISRRGLLKGAAAVAGAAIGSETITGFPTVWAQNIKNIELNHVGVSYSVVKAIGDQASKD